jgi:3-deoxy-D-manno-octulosonate 8-phosphate phosphatase (KDO 8-P phosphatase)
VPASCERIAAGLLCYTFYFFFPEGALAGRTKGVKISVSLKKRAAKINVVLMDVDGTITDGSVSLLSQPDGSALEMKTFDAHDGQGISLARTAGLRMGVITGRESPALRRRMKELGVEFVYEKQPHKIAAYEEILKKSGVTEEEVAYLGDDLPDLTVMRRVGLAVAVGNAAREVKDAAHYTTIRHGGKGAARELIELILKSKGTWDEMIDKARA